MGKIHPAAIAQITATLEMIDDALRHLLEEHHGQSLDCLFYPAALYTQMCRRLLSGHPAHPDLDTAVKHVLPVFVSCKNLIASRASDLEHIFSGEEDDSKQGMVLFSEEWWNVLFSSDNLSHTSPSQVGDGDPSNDIVFEAPMEAVAAVSGNIVALETHRTVRAPLASSEQDDATKQWTIDSIV